MTRADDTRLDTRLAAARVGGRAAAALARPGPARVHAAFARSLYVEIRGRLVCLAGPELGPGPITAEVTAERAGAARLPALEPGARGELAGRQLRLPGLVVDFSRSRLWMPPAFVRPVPRAEVEVFLATLRDLAARSASPPGLCRLLAGEDATKGGEADRAVLTRVEAARRALAAWLGGPADAPPPRPVVELLGLGPGLTPAGDDFLAGVLLALGRLKLQRHRAALAARVAASAEATGRISREHLLAAADGEAGAAVHAVLGAIGDDERRLGERIRALARVGHTSGWDVLAGIACTLAAAR